MRHPFQSLPTGTSSTLLIVSFGITLFLMWKLSQIGTSLNIPKLAPKGILSLEFAGSSVKAKAIVDAWRQAAVLDQAKNLQRLDFAFIAAYSAALSLSCIWVTALLPEFEAKWLNIGIALAWGQWVAGLLDVIENLALLPFLYVEAKDNLPLAQIATFCAACKFSLIVTGLLYILVSIVIKLILI